jgi:hypothetical protein
MTELRLATAAEAAHILGTTRAQVVELARSAPDVPPPRPPSPVAAG